MEKMYGLPAPVRLRKERECSSRSWLDAQDVSVPITCNQGLACRKGEVNKEIFVGTWWSVNENVIRVCSPDGPVWMICLGTNWTQTPDEWEIYLVRIMPEKILSDKDFQGLKCFFGGHLKRPKLLDAHRPHRAVRNFYPSAFCIRSSEETWAGRSHEPS